MANSKIDTQTKKLSPDGLTEALLEVRFSCDDFPDLVPAKLSDMDFAKGFELHRVATADIPPAIRRVDPSLQYSPIFQSISPNKDRLANIGEQSFSWHVLKPYCGWPTFSMEISNAINHVFSKLTNVRANRIGLRYINMLNEPEHQIRDLSALSLDLTIAGQQVLSEVNINYSRKKADTHAIIKIATPEFVQGGTIPFSLLLDIDVSTPHNFLCSDSTQIIEWVSRAHEFLEGEFFSLLHPTVLARLSVK